MLSLVMLLSDLEWWSDELPLFVAYSKMYSFSC